MFLVQEILQFGNGRNTEAVARLNWIHSLMQPAPGFLGAQICQYLGNSMRHLILRMWEDKEAFEAFRATPDGSGYSASRPPGIYEGQPCGRQWTLASEMQGRVEGNFLIRAEVDVADGRWDDYMTLKKAQDRIHQAAGGLVYAWHFRQLDADDGALLLIRKTNRDDHMRYVESLMKSQLRDTGPQNTSTPRGDYMEYYEVIDETKPS